MVYTKFVYTYCSPYLLFLLIVGILSSQTIQQVKAFNSTHTTTSNPEKTENPFSSPIPSSTTEDGDGVDLDSFTDLPSPTEPSEAGKDMILLPPSVFESTTVKSKHHRNLKSLVQRKMPFY